MTRESDKPVRQRIEPETVSRPQQRPRTSPDGEVRTRWAWAEPSIWTNRMLTALENGVRGGKWHSLIDKVYTRRNLEAAYRRVAANGGASGVDHVTIEAFARRLDGNLDHLSRTLREGTYRPQAVKRVYIPKLGKQRKTPAGNSNGP